jgi:hypothetical protein
MTKQRLHGSDVVAVLEQRRRKRMPVAMTACALRETSLPNGRGHRVPLVMPSSTDAFADRPCHQALLRITPHDTVQSGTRENIRVESAMCSPS